MNETLEQAIIRVRQLEEKNQRLMSAIKPFADFWDGYETWHHERRQKPIGSFFESSQFHDISKVYREEAAPVQIIDDPFDADLREWRAQNGFTILRLKNNFYGQDDTVINEEGSFVLAIRSNGQNGVVSGWLILSCDVPCVLKDEDVEIVHEDELL